MLFKNGINYADFFTNVNKCRGEVWLLTEEGDKLNLKSTLSQYVFVVMNGQLKISGTVHCDESSDFRFLEKFLSSVEY